MTDNSITLLFSDKETADYVRIICTRKGTSIEDYILNNFEWDDPLPCLSDLNEGEKITVQVCNGCDYLDSCPDAVMVEGKGGE